ncbi:MAG: DUF7455 domain-containing protein [Pseudonocardia sp.]
MSTTLSRWTGQAAGQRCDRCFARAQVRVLFPSGNDLLFCGHHARKHRDGLSGLEVEMLPGAADRGM